MSRPNPLEAVEFGLNPAARCACVLLLDTSYSMQGAKIEALYQGLQLFANALKDDQPASVSIEPAIVTFDSEVNVVSDFVTANSFEPPVLTAHGTTCMGSGILRALDMIRERKDAYKRNGIAYYRPWVFMITDGEPHGEPNDIVAQAAQQIRDDEAGKHVAFFGVGVEGANMERLAAIVQRQPLMLKETSFSEMFRWSAENLKSVSRSKTDDQVQLTPAGWGSV